MADPADAAAEQQARAEAAREARLGSTRTHALCGGVYAAGALSGHLEVCPELTAMVSR